MEDKIKSVNKYIASYMRNTTFILIALLIILLCGLAAPYFNEGFTEGATCGVDKDKCKKSDDCCKRFSCVKEGNDNVCKPKAQ